MNAIPDISVKKIALKGIHIGIIAATAFVLVK